MGSTGILTGYGISALAAAVQGNYAPPLYLVIENTGSTLVSSISAGANTLQSVAKVDLAGDSQLVLGVGTTAQETVGFSGVTGSGPYTYTLSTPTLYAHASGDPLCRLPLPSDTMAQVVGEIEYDHANQPGQRLQSISGYSTASGEWTMQFFLTGIEANTFIMMVGLSDSPLIGQGNLHAHATVGINHTFTTLSAAKDIELDLPITLASS